MRWLALLALPACLSLPPRPPDHSDDGGVDGPPAMPKLLFGNDTVFNNANVLLAGNAYAASFQVPSTGNVHSIVVYLDAATAGTTVEAGIYGSSSGSPDVLFSQKDVMTVAGSGWLRIPVLETSVTADDTFWLAVMCPLSTCDRLGVMSASPLQPGSCFAPPAGCVDAEQNLTSALPGNWASYTTSANSLSIYASDQ